MPSKSPPPPIVSHSRKYPPEPVSYDFPEGILGEAKNITLADLLDNPATQCWTVSAISNSVRHAIAFVDDLSPKDSHQAFLLKRLLAKIPKEERDELYGCTLDFITSHHKRK